MAKLFETLFLLVLISAVWACSQDTSEEIFVDSELAPFFERFQLEAAARGITFDFVDSRIEGYVTDISERNVSGKCEFNSTYPDRIYIDQLFWRRAGFYEKEFVVFHELGHCFLEREHLDATDAAGNCISIMQSGQGFCRNAYGPLTRSEYLDELFSEQ